MKILIAHNSYQHRGGEDVMVDAEMALLQEYGHTLHAYRRHNDEIGTQSRAGTALQTLWSARTAREIDALCTAFAPDLIHVHNSFPLISPAIYWAAARRRIPVVQTLHNFRLVCPEAMLLRNGKVCEDCVGRTPLPGIVHRCYRGSLAQTAAVAAMTTLHRAVGTWDRKVARYIVLNTFCRERFVRGGLPPERLSIKPNFVRQERTPTWESRRGGLYVGRLSEEKGLAVLTRAAGLGALSPVQVIGDGPMQADVAQAFGPRYLGYLPARDVHALLHQALYLVAPSTCYETFGLAALEAFACGTAVIASRHGGLGELVTDGVTGLLFTPGDAAELGEKIAWAESHPAEMMRMGQAARREYERNYTPERNYRRLMEIYQEALDCVRDSAQPTRAVAGDTLAERSSGRLD